RARASAAVAGRRPDSSAIWRAAFAADQTDEEKIRVLLAPFREITIDRDIAEIAGKLHRETEIRAPQALIAATALHHRLTLVTRNRRDYEPVRRLRLRDPR